MERIESITIGGLGEDPNVQIRNSVKKLSFDLAMDAVSEITITVYDPDLEMNQAGYWQIRQQVTYESELYEIAAVDLNLAENKSEEVVIKARTKAIQELRRDKGALNAGTMSPTSWAASVAAANGLGFFGEESAEKEHIVRQERDNADESTWDVLQRLAADIEFICYEAGGVLFFASEKKIAETQPTIEVWWPSTPSMDWFAHSLTLHRSDDDPRGGNLRVALTPRENAIQLRPGMTIHLNGIYRFGQKKYLIDRVQWDEASPEPVGVSARTMDEEEEEE